MKCSDIHNIVYSHLNPFLAKNIDFSILNGAKSTYTIRILDSNHFRCGKCQSASCGGCVLSTNEDEFFEFQDKELCVLWEDVAFLSFLRNAFSIKCEETKNQSKFPTCVICEEFERDTLIMPCCHLVSCENCASKIDKCPICRVKIAGKIKCFF
jgi:hypothetical protein